MVEDGLYSKFSTPPLGGYILNGELSLNHLSDILSTTIKGDKVNSKVLFLGTLLNYTEEDQQNIAFTAPSSTGKSYLALEIVQYFPEEDVEKHDYASPKSFFWEKGELVDAETGIGLIQRDQFIKDYIDSWEKENPKPKARRGVGDWRDDRQQIRLEAKQAWEDIDKIYKVDLERKILVFKDQPHAELLAMLRSLLSHDEKEMRNKIVDKSEGGGNKTRHIWVIGYPTCIFATASFIQEEQEQTRFFILSPEVEQNKIRQAIQLLGEKLGDRPKFVNGLEQNEARRMLKERVKLIKEANIKEIIIDPNLVEITVSRFLKEHPRLSPRHMRDFPRLISLIKGHALLNQFNRQGDGTRIWANEADVEEGYNLYDEISESNELGLPPIVYKFYMEKLKPVLDTGAYMMRQEENRLYHEMYNIMIGDEKLKEMNELLSAAGLVIEDVNPKDRRFKIIYSPGGV